MLFLGCLPGVRALYDSATINHLGVPFTKAYLGFGDAPALRRPLFSTTTVSPLPYLPPSPSASMIPNWDMRVGTQTGRPAWFYASQSLLSPIIASVQPLTMRATAACVLQHLVEPCVVIKFKRKRRMDIASSHTDGVDDKFTRPQKNEINEAILELNPD